MRNIGGGGKDWLEVNTRTEVMEKLDHNFMKGQTHIHNRTILFSKFDDFTQNFCIYRQKEERNNG
jgi:hypothetical protein